MTPLLSVEQRKPWWLIPVLIVALPLALVLAVIWLTCAVLLLLVIWLTWFPRGRFALVVYSNSPVWQEYFERQVIPHLGNRAVILNWSDRRRWKLTLAVILFHLFAGSRDFNPIAIIVRPLRWPRTFRFYKAFRSFKRGRDADVEELRREFLKQLDAI
jgi:hypothetical protein